MFRYVFHAAALGCFGAALLFPCAQAAAAGPGSFELDLKELPPVKQSRPSPHTAAPRSGKGEASRLPAGQSRYTVKPGDHIFKILMRDYGLSNRQAELLIPEIISLNNIADIKRLQVGQTLLIPLGRHHHKPSATQHRSEKKAVEREAAAGETAPAPKPAPPEPPHPATPAVPPPAAAAPSSVPIVAPPVKEVPLSAPLPPVFPAPVDILTVTATDTPDIVDNLLELLGIRVEKNRIVESGRDASDGTFISIKVDRFFTYHGNDYILALGQPDPFNFTLLRVLQAAGRRVVIIQPGDSFQTIGKKLLDAMQWPYTFGTQELRLSADSNQIRNVDGFMLVTDGAIPKQLLITNTPVTTRSNPTPAH